MNTDNRAQYLTRNSIIALLSDAEIASVSVSTAETAVCLAQGDEYLDLDHLQQGVQRSHATTPMARVLPRKAVSERTWERILRQLAAPGVATPHSGGRTDDSY